MNSARRFIVHLVALFLLVLPLFFFRIFPLGAQVPISKISSVVGVVVDGQSIIINGSIFGSTGPTVVLFDDFENNVVGSAVNLSGIAGPKVGQWGCREPSGGVLTATATGVRAGSKVARFDNNNPGGHFDVLTATWPTIGNGYSDEIFVSGWEKIEEGTQISACSSGNANLKDIWVYRDSIHNICNGDPRSDIFHGSNSCGVSGDGGDPTNDTMGVAGNNTSADTMCNLSQGYHATRSRLGPGTWVRMQEYYKQNPDGTGVFQDSQIPWVRNTGDPQYNSTGEMMRLSCSGALMSQGYAPWDSVGINGYGRWNAGNASVFQWDDIYIAIGSGARARVEMMSAQTWGDSAHRLDMNASICTPTSWSSNSVNCTVRQGSFANGQTAYLFVIDSNGNVSDQDGNTANGSQGYAVTVAGGAAPDTQAPTAPSNLIASISLTWGETSFASAMVSFFKSIFDTLTLHLFS